MLKIVGFVVLTLCILLVLSLWRAAARSRNRERDDREQIAYMQTWRGKCR